MERIGAAESIWSFQRGDFPAEKGAGFFPDYAAAIRWLEERLGGFSNLAAVGFKPVMAQEISGTQVMDERVLQAMEAVNTLLPAHNPPYIAAVRSFRAAHPELPCIGTFETAFYDQLPAHNRRYPVPLEWETRYGIRRHGFHGASHRYVTQRCAELLGRERLRLISCHLGGSSSIAAVRDGLAIDSSWGMTPQSGLPQNNRVGDFDVFALIYLARDQGLGIDAVEKALTTEAGLKGMSGLPSGDLRDIVEASENGNANAQIALDVLVGSIRKYIGQFLVELNGADALIFTAGMGENESFLREAVCANLDFCGLEIDLNLNRVTRATETKISTSRSKIDVWVIPTNEEIIIARNAWAKISTP
ncbi:acetate kinase [Alphaproteobacteria bacterium]|nr:acetate kinase [Alphaproteobacteria bacterium]